MQDWCHSLANSLLELSKYYSHFKQLFVWEQLRIGSIQLGKLTNLGTLSYSKQTVTVLENSKLEKAYAKVEAKMSLTSNCKKLWNFFSKYWFIASTS